MPRKEILKTYKLFIGGQFPRSESGRYYPLQYSKEQIANVSLASRKDLKSAVVAARSSFPGWSGKSHFNRSQILYRIAEMMEGRKEQFISELMQLGLTKKNAETEVGLAIDRWVYYSGWCDKYSALFSSVNPVSSSHFNFSVPEPMGVVSVIAPEKSGLLGLISVTAPVIAGGNTCVVLASEKLPLPAITMGEVLATSDLPSGVINILTGKSEELLQHFSSHMDINAIIYCRNNKEEMSMVGQNASLNVKRSFFWDRPWNSKESMDPYMILDLQELKTTWHPIEQTAVSGSRY